MELVLIRHPAPLVAPGLCYGSSDLQADPAALAACHSALATPPAAPPAAPTPAELLAWPVYSSPLQRCSALAGLLAAAPGRPAALRQARLDARLAELHFGDWELRPWTEIPRREIDAWAADLPHYRPGGGESVLDAASRVQSFLRALDGPAIVVCHAGTIRLVQALAGGAALHAAAQRAAATPHALAYGSAHRVIIE